MDAQESFGGRPQLRRDINGRFYSFSVSHSVKILGGMTKTGFQSAFEDILGLPPGSLKDDDGRDNLTGWTSLADVQLFTVITAELGIEPDGELLEADRAGDLIRILESRGAFQG